MVRRYSRILVTGGAGFIGSHLVETLLDEGCEVIVLDNLETGSHDNIAHHQSKEELRFVKGDIRDFTLVRKAMEEVDAVFHEAALISVPLSMENPILVNDANVTGTLNVLEASLRLGVKRLIYASSAAVYGATSSARMKEDMIPMPTSPYGASKLAAEYYVRLFYKLYGIETVSLRYFNVYGPRQRFDMRTAYGNVVTLFINTLLRNKSPVIYGDGEQTRDFVYIQDVVKANMLALESRKVVGEVINVGTGKEVSVNRLAQILKEIMGKTKIENTHTDPRPGDVRHGYADVNKAKRVLGYHPDFTIEQGLLELVDWYTDNKYKS